MDGVVRTRVGYAGGTSEDPTYRRIGDHAECIQVDYDPEKLSYADLLSAFLTMHDPTRPGHSTQYASVVLAHDEAQATAADATLRDLSTVTGKTLSTQVRILTEFFVAEDYHQKYALRSDSVLMASMRGYYPLEADLRESTAAARVNGYAYGAGGLTLLQRDVDSFGLGEEGKRHLLYKVGGR